MKWSPFSLVAAFVACLFISQAALARGSDDDGDGISMGRYITGGVLGTAIGLGIGHAVQGRYLPLGLVYSLGEAASLGAMIADSTTTTTTDSYGFQRTDLHLGTAGAIGLAAYLGLHIWEIVDVWVNGADCVRHRSSAKESDSDTAPPPTLALAPVAGNGGAPGVTLFLRF